ncbi:HAD family hydrolase [Gemmobacter denitrificans]|uniref:phosphoglycolate phosphatase n=1 Tax=Gemmobacter denitrificans TaxID=3123040 RepID=A0ABU8BWD9_9RHOB
MIEGLVFDKDGTLFDFRRSWGNWVIRLLEGIADGPEHRNQLARSIGFDIDRIDFAPDSPVIAATAPEIAARMNGHLPRMSHEELTDRMNRLAGQADMAEAVPLRPLFQALRDRGLKIGLATNDTEAPARTHLTNHGVIDLFDFVAGYDSGHGGKPAPGQLLAFARQVGLPPARIAMVGDSRHDMEAGRAAGMVCVAVLTGIADHAELAPHADVVLPDIGHLPAWLAESVPA